MTTTQQTSRIPIQRYCWACDAAFEATDPNQRNCDTCIAHYREQRGDPWWRGLEAELAAPVPDIAAAQRARTDRALARLRASEQRIDRQMLDQWLDSYSAQDYLPESES